MKIKTSVILLSIGVWIFLFFSPDLAMAKDPDYPTKPITFYIPYAAGGMTDVAVRPLLEAVGKHLGQPIIPINKPGGGASIGAMAVMNAKPNGYTLGACAGAQALVQPHTGEVPYKDLSGFTFIMNFSRYVVPVVVRSDAPYKTWKEFIEWAKQHPRATKVGLPGSRSGTPQGIALWEFEQKEKVALTYIPFKGSADSLSAILGGHITMETIGIDPPRMPYLKEGKLRILAYLSKEKVPGYEDFASFEELYGIIFASIMGVWGPGNLPQYVLGRLDDGFAKGVRDPHFTAMMNRVSMPVVYLNRKDLNRYVMEVFPRVGEAVKKLRAQEAKEKK